MSRYMDIAAEANLTAQRLLELVPDDLKPRAAEMIARLVNYGIRCAPRAVHGTVRLNAVTRAVKDLPVMVSMREVKDEKTGRSFKALITKPLCPGAEVTVEGPNADEE